MTATAALKAPLTPTSPSRALSVVGVSPIQSIRRKQDEARVEARAAADAVVADILRVAADAAEIGSLIDVLPAGVLDLFTRFAESAQGSANNAAAILGRTGG